MSFSQQDGRYHRTSAHHPTTAALYDCPVVAALPCTPVVPNLLHAGRDGLVARDVPLQHIPVVATAQVRGAKLELDSNKLHCIQQPLLSSAAERACTWPTC